MKKLKNEVIQIRLSEDEKFFFQLFAAAAGLTTSEYIRNLVNEDIERRRLHEDVQKI